jgi:hypothetical protein
VKARKIENTAHYNKIHKEKYKNKRKRIVEARGIELGTYMYVLKSVYRSTTTTAVDDG